MWADEDTGSSSAGPWISPSATVSARRGSARLVRRIGGRLAGRAAVATPADEQPDGAEHDRRGDDVVEVVEVVLPLLPARPDLATDEREHEDPRDAARRGQQREAPERHPRDAGGQRDE